MDRLPLAMGRYANQDRLHGNKHLEAYLAKNGLYVMISILSI